MKISTDIELPKGRDNAWAHVIDVTGQLREATRALRLASAGTNQEGEDIDPAGDSDAVHVIAEAIKAVLAGCWPNWAQFPLHLDMTEFHTSENSHDQPRLVFAVKVTPLQSTRQR